MDGKRRQGVRTVRLRACPPVWVKESVEGVCEYVSWSLSSTTGHGPDLLPCAMSGDLIRSRPVKGSWSEAQMFPKWPRGTAGAENGWMGTGQGGPAEPGRRRRRAWERWQRLRDAVQRKSRDHPSPDWLPEEVPEGS